MSDDDDTPPAVAPEARSGWSEQDRRTLIITIAGGLAANIATVILVGGAIALVHTGKAPSGYRLVVALVFVAIGAGLMVIGGVSRRARGARRRSGVAGLLDPYGAWGWPLLGLGSVVLLEGVLILTGLAAGVK
jgi:hypothetical protein